VRPPKAKATPQDSSTISQVGQFGATSTLESLQPSDLDTVSTLGYASNMSSWQVLQSLIERITQCAPSCRVVSLQLLQVPKPPPNRGQLLEVRNLQQRPRGLHLYERPQELSKEFLADVTSFANATGGDIHNTYRLGRILGDVQAVRRGPTAIVRRVERKWLGRLFGRFLRKV
jgi:hypothetical protein